MTVLEHHNRWLAAFQAGWLAHYRRTGQIDWGLYERPQNEGAIAGPGIELEKSSLLLVSTAGGYVRGQQDPFDAANPLGDYTIRTFPSSVSADELAYAHDHYDHTAVERDLQVLLPLQHLQDLVAEGTIGELAPSVVSFMGYQPDVTRVVDETAPAILRAARAMQAQAALFVPA